MREEADTMAGINEGEGRNRPAPGAIFEGKQRDPARFLELLACPRCGAHPLQLSDAVLTCSGCGRRYQVVDGVPVLREGPVTVMPSEHISNPIEQQDVLAWLATLDGYSLNVGAGASDYVIPTSVELEYSVFRNTDVAGDAHHLPFRDNVFEAVVSFNTFEHLDNPQAAAREAFRVLKPGGRLLVQSAFVQPLHEEPYHYYDATEYGLRQWFSDFDILRCTVPDNGVPTLAVAWLCNDVLHAVGASLGPDVEEAVGATTVRDWAQIWANREDRQGFIWDVMKRIPEETQRRFAGTLELEAKKPS